MYNHVKGPVRNPVGSCLQKLHNKILGGNSSTVNYMTVGMLYHVYISSVQVNRNAKPNEAAWYRTVMEQHGIPVNKELADIQKVASQRYPIYSRLTTKEQSNCKQKKYLIMF